MAAFALSRDSARSRIALLVAGGRGLMVVFAIFMTLVQSSVEDRCAGASSASTPSRSAARCRSATWPPGSSRRFSAPPVLIMNGLVLVLVGTIVLLRHSKSGVTSL